MKHRVVVAAAAVLVIGGAASCSSGPMPLKSEPGTLPPGAAQLTIDGKDTSTSEAVQCSTVDSLTTITTGADSSGATVMVSNAEELTVEFVRIRNLSGFTGNYNRGLEGSATAAMTGPMYNIAGAALGYTAKSTERMAEPFAIKVSC